MKFTDRFIKGIRPKQSAYRIFEKGPDKGFGIKITPAGSISFFIQYSTSGKQRFYNLGRYPSTSLADARDACRLTRLQVDRGIDPQTETLAQHGTINHLFDYYIKYMEESGKRTWKKVKSDLDHNCSDIKSIQAKDITPGHIRKILHAIIERGSEVQANRVRSYLHRAFELGIHHDNDPRNLKNEFTFSLTANPVDAVPKNTHAESIGERNLSFAELELLWNSNELSPSFHAAVKLLLIYGCRTWELMGAERTEFDFNGMVWSIPPARIKNRRWHLLPITPLANKLLIYLEPYSRDSMYLFPGRYQDDKLMGKDSLGHAIKRMTGIDPFTPRDLRRTVKTRMGEIGIEKSIRDRLQNHAISDVSAKHYDRYDYLNEKKQALLLWENRLRRLEKE